ncbi:palmitoyltransferase protein [Dioscorea alata]|uniref:Palmitoyltransferase protein n=1 Tax=Dioscorea alata TaxID=55571 RepID=A0ACB7V770_DIOAL|nr:palmitoyltransferase protein [Dioscorea alata]
MDEEAAKEEHCTDYMNVTHETTCWGCGLRILLSSTSSIFKCGWCGAITNRNQSQRKPDSKWFHRWRCLRDRFFVVVVILFMLIVICAGVWAVYPTVFSISYFCGVFHCSITAILSIITFSSFFLAAFRHAGRSANVEWGRYPIVGQGGLENYTFCLYCRKPKCPRTHHCRSCRTCVFDMDHHCPFIGNCVGAANHRSFIAFLVSIIISCTYVAIMTTYAAYHIWPPLEISMRYNHQHAVTVLKMVVTALARSVLLLPLRGFVLIYLAFASLSVEIGIFVLLWQQLCLIYEGNTYINSLSFENNIDVGRGCHNLLCFFGCPYLAYRILLGSANAIKFQQRLSSKLL